MAIAKKKKKSVRTTANKVETNSPSLTHSRIEQYYSKIVIGFVALTVLLISLILYFSFSKTIITIYPRPIDETFSISTTLQELDGVIVLTDVEGSKVFSQFNSSETRPGFANGTVTLINNYTRDQPLVEKTRLLSEDGILFRTKETVTVPAGGTVDVAVIADEEGKNGNVPPGRFTIVALWEGLQKDIYGESSSAMSGGVVNVTAVTQTDIENARNLLHDELVDSARQVFQEEVPTYEGMPDNPYLLDAISVVTVLKDDVNVSAGDEVDSILATQKVTVAAPVVNADSLVNFLQSKLEDTLSEGREFVQEISLDQVTLTLENIAEDKSDADIIATVNTQVVLSLIHI